MFALQFPAASATAGVAVRRQAGAGRCIAAAAPSGRCHPSRSSRPAYLGVAARRAAPGASRPPNADATLSELLRSFANHECFKFSMRTGLSGLAARPSPCDTTLGAAPLPSIHPRRRRRCSRARRVLAACSDLPPSPRPGLSLAPTGHGRPTTSTANAVDCGGEDAPCAAEDPGTGVVQDDLDSIIEVRASTPPPLFPTRRALFPSPFPE